ncbi:ATP-binding protein [Gracilibacillus xinjiangensis]|uniref:AAA family ATPase n=1 Tax=Gracilibacillus xinjiangensis TaxID=1193282 RepID=A0ABV8WX41_9BACI
MRIEHVHIYGFGKWQDQQFSFHSSPFQQIVGENEAGKSTLRQFILYILFGQTMKKLDVFMPKQGAQIGGKLTISGIVPENIVVERIHGRNKGNAIIYLVNGEIKEEEWLKQKWKGIDRSYYEAIYTFDAMDLQKIHQLNNEALNEVLLAIGMTGSDRIYYTEKQLDKRRLELFKPYGKKPEINQLFDKLADLKEKLVSTKREEATYQKKLEEIKILENEIKLMEAKLQEMQTDYRTYEKKRTHYQMIESYFLLCQQLNRLRAPSKFPASGLARYYTLKENLLPIQSEANVLERTKQELTQQINQLQNEQLTAEQFETLQECASLMEEITYHKPMIEKMEREVNHYREELETKLQQLGIPLSIEALEEISFPFHLEELWSDLAKQKEQLEMEKQYIGEEIRSSERLLAELDKNIEQEQQNLMDEAILSQYKQEVDASAEYRNKQSQIKNYKKLARQLNKWTTISLLLLAAGIAFAILLLWQNQLQWAMVLAVITFLPFFGLKIASRLTDQWFRPEQQTGFHLSEQELTERKSVIEEQQIIQDSLTQLIGNRKKQNLEQLKLEERYYSVRARLQQLNEKIADQIAHYPFLEPINITYWSKLFQQFLIMKEKLAEYNKARDQLRRKKHYLQQLQEDLSKKETTEQDFSVEIESEQKRRDKLHQLQSQIKKIDVDIQSNLEKQKPYFTEMSNLFQQANVTEEEAFITNGKNFEEKSELEQKQNQLTDSLSVLFDEMEIEQFAKGQYEDDVTLEQMLQQLQQQIEQQKEILSGNRQKLSDLRASITLLEGKEDASIMRHQYEQLKERTNQLAKEWAINQIATEKIAKAKAKYYADYIPKVFEYASSYFVQLTNAKYKEIFIPNENEWIKVMDTDGFVFTIAELSQGTKDQLYIALRLALSRIASAEIRLPFLIDDGFVHFDPKRKAFILQVLEEISKEHQVFYFTTYTKSETALQL